MQGIHPDFETQGRHYQKSKTGVSVAPQKGHMSSNFFKKVDAVRFFSGLLIHKQMDSLRTFKQDLSDPTNNPKNHVEN